jgi:hypothetical protein
MLPAMDQPDLDLRNATYRALIELGRAPTQGELAAATGLSTTAVAEGWLRLHDAHALVLDADGAIAMLNPFAARPTPFRVEAGGRSWWANCGWDAFGIGAALGVDSVIHTACPDCAEAITLHVRDGHPIETEAVWHVLVPASSWWNDIGFT